MSNDNGKGIATPWTVLESKITFEDRWLKIRTDRCAIPSGMEIAAYHVIEAPDWACVVALTRDLKLVMLREYRHARSRVIEGIPGGILERSDADGSIDVAEAGARRELLEETGYGGGRFLPIMTTYPDPGNQTNMATAFLALGVELQAAQSLDIGETAEVFLDDLPAVLVRLTSGELRVHAVHVAALWSAAARILAGGEDVDETAPLKERLIAAITGGLRS